MDINAKRTKVYVASSWRNDYQPGVVQALSAHGFEVYDFKDSEGFSWSEVDPDWLKWPDDRQKYLDGLEHPAAERGFNRDMEALDGADIVIVVMPCGVSAALEAGFAVGNGKPTAVYIPAMREPDLMFAMCDFLCLTLDEVIAWAAETRDGIEKLPMPMEIER